MDFDRTVIGGLVVDGTGARAYPADLGIRRGRLEAIGDLAAVPAGERIDARGRAVCRAAPVPGGHRARSGRGRDDRPERAAHGRAGGRVLRRP
jgi:hypothetical protein